MVKSENHNIQTEKKKYKGVRMRSWGSYVSEIRAPNQKTRIWLGSYSTPEAAARAYDVALLCLKGKSVNLNFPITSYQNLNFPSDTSPKSIQKVAAAAAAASTDIFFNDASLSVSFSSTSSCYESATSSPSMSSSPSSYHVEDDFSMVSSSCGENEIMACYAQSWYNFDSPKYNDMMINGGYFNPPMVEDVAYDEGDMRLWNFS